MRAGIVAWSIGLALLLSGCDTTDSRFFRYGIGTELYTEDIVQATQLQDIYLTELCRQAVPPQSVADGQCVSMRPTSSGWDLIVQAGLNDIDRRCDAYLAWLDDRRRTNTAVLKELGDLAVASQAIMRVTGVGANPITIAGLAFGLASNTFININSRLLLEVDKTTVQTLVLRRRGEFRTKLKTISVTDRPNAVYAMRQYLTICTPFAIETDINSTITVFQQVGPGGLIDKPPLLNTEAVGRPFTASTSIATRPQRGPEKPTIDPEIAKLVVKPNKATSTIEAMTGIASKLCLPKADVENSKMIAGIQIYQMTQRDVLNKPTTKVTGKLTDAQLLDLQNASPCDTAKFRNYYEASSAVPGGIGNPDVVVLLNRGLAKEKRLPLTPKPTDSQIRTAITEVQKTLPNLTLKGSEVEGQLTPELIGALQKAPDPTP
jgi:hypothetical protein